MDVHVPLGHMGPADSYPRVVSGGWAAVIALLSRHRISPRHRFHCLFGDMGLLDFNCTGVVRCHEPTQDLAAPPVSLVGRHAIHPHHSESDVLFSPLGNMGPATFPRTWLLPPSLIAAPTLPRVILRSVAPIAFPQYLSPSYAISRARRLHPRMTNARLHIASVYLVPSPTRVYMATTAGLELRDVRLRDGDNVPSYSIAGPVSIPS
ncbi:hypothetical protein BD779DRAFT_1477385 [Infundibulicybe gibba]|nr:hypothetical protein BD779DRAFT_1477385 [Infundibulicybe gibba]